MPQLDIIDLVALGWFIVAWLGFGLIVDLTHLGGPSLSKLMDDHRRRWMEVVRQRDNRIVDSSIMGSLQNGTAFFASTSMIALGGAFTLLNQTDRMVQLFQDLPFYVSTSKNLLEMKVVGLVVIYGYSFFKFGWAYRLFNYTAILLGAIPTAAHQEEIGAKMAAWRAAEMQIDAGHHFHWGLRALFFSIGFFGWFLNAWIFMGTTTFILGVLIRRQYLSLARAALLAEEPVSLAKRGSAP